MEINLNQDIFIEDIGYRLIAIYGTKIILAPHIVDNGQRNITITVIPQPYPEGRNK